MNPFPSKCSCHDNSKSKRKRKRTSARPSDEIKQEVVVKEEPKDNTEMVDITRPHRWPSSAEATGALKSEFETDNELDFDYDDNFVKEEVKSECECAKKECDSKQNVSFNDGDDDVPGDSVVNPGPYSNSKGKKKKRKVKDEKLSNQKKVTSVKASKKAAVKRQKKHKCNLCSYVASFKSCLIMHTRVHTGEKPFTCEVCAKSFTQKSHLRQHEKIHGPRLTFRCSKCRKRFAQEINKGDHESKCQRRQYECFACKYITQELSSMRRHMRTHSGLKPFECSVCSRTFIQKIHLHRHSRTHVKHLPFACLKCGKRFAQENNKQLHEQRCSCRRFECYLCQYECFEKTYLKKHMRPKHTGEKSFHCELCDARFSTQNNENRHMKNVHRQKK